MIGSVLPYIATDWSQAGIAQLYQMISRNGYKFLYLSARAIGQSKLTRDYLRGVRQSDVNLPDGPLLLSPSSLMSAFHK
jgi:phosphatidate phosphatase LPIN